MIYPIGKSFSFASLTARQIGNPRLTNLKTCACALINFAYKSVKHLNFLGSGAVRIFDGFVYDYFFDERIEHFSG